jgi:hypothetical protein
MTLWEKIAALSSEVVKEQGLATLDKPMDADLFRFLHYLQEKVEQQERDGQCRQSPHLGN